MDFVDTTILFTIVFMQELVGTSVWQLAIVYTTDFSCEINVEVRNSRRITRSGFSQSCSTILISAHIWFRENALECSSKWTGFEN